MSGTLRSGSRRRSTRATSILIIAVAALVVAALAVVFALRNDSTEPADPVAVTVPVALPGAGIPDALKIGVVVTQGRSLAEGSEWAAAAEGAAVAQYRLARGGSQVEILVENDRGTVAGSLEAVAALQDQGVSGIVFATSGAHLADGVAAAGAAGIPAMLPYAEIPDASAPAIWSFAPSTAEVLHAFTELINDFDHPVLLSAGPGIPEGVPTDETLAAADGDLQRLAAEAARRLGAETDAHGAYSGTADEAGEIEGAEPEADQPRADALVLSGHPRAVAILVTQLQERNVDVPLILPPSATSPAFAEALETQGGSVTPALETVGADLGDAVALGHSNVSRATSAYLQAVRRLADDPDATNLTGDAHFAEVSTAADVRAHDAVLALALAAGAARSTDAAQVGAELSALRLDAADGVASSTLDFSTPNPADTEMHRLFATSESLGLRPRTAGLALSWFPEPSA